MYNKDKVGVVIINYNSADYIFNCLEHVFKQTVNTKVVVIDNTPSDGVAERINKIYEGQVEVLCTGTNLGAAKANNLGIVACGTYYTLVLNADVYLSQNYIEKLVEQMESDSNISECQGLLVSESNDQVIDSAGVEFFSEVVGIDRAYGKDITSQELQSQLVDGTCCAAALYRRTSLDQIALSDGEFYDQDLFAYYEDYDLSRRLRFINSKAHFCKEALGRHVRGGSTAKESDFVKVLRISNLFLLYRRYSGQQNIISKVLNILFLSIIFIKGLDCIKPVTERIKTIKLRKIKNARNLPNKRSYLLNKFIKEI
ncbi:glycosyltransferase family 2 protein [Litoribacillus peritrichatus]|uniref:Glycosyltransferase 2-like domain-containing protein n=1 Tax=Litoribacillus peritrichatus TaxID=718191 RepID=A0ABP7LZU3_9GAMM